MRSFGKLAACGALACGMALAAPSAAFAQMGEGEDLQSYRQYAKSGSDADKTIARAKVVTRALQETFKYWSFAVIKGKMRKRIVHTVFDILQDEKFKKRRGKFRYQCNISREELQNRILDILQPHKTFGRSKFIVVAWHRGWYEGGGLKPKEIRVIHETVKTSVGDMLTSNRMRRSPKASQREQVARAAVELGADPTTKSLHSFSNMFQAPMVITVKGNIKFEKKNMGGGFNGYLRCQGIKARVYDKDTDRIMAEFMLQSRRKWNEPSQATPKFMHCPWVKLGTDSLSEKTEIYARQIGMMLGTQILKKLMVTYFASLKWPEPKVKSLPRDCPGCGDKIVDGAVKTCPACESPLPAAKTVTVGGTGGPTGIMPHHYHNLRFKGFKQDKIAEFMEQLEEDKEFGNYNDRGKTGIFYVWECTYIGKKIFMALKDALDELGWSNKVKITKTGNNVNLIWKG